MQPGINADFWAGLGLLVFLLGTPVVAVTTIIVMWNDFASRVRYLRSSGPNPWDLGFLVGISGTTLITIALHGAVLGVLAGLCFALFWRVIEDLSKRRAATQSDEARISAIAWRVGLLPMIYLAVYALAYFSFAMAGLLVGAVVHTVVARTTARWYETALAAIAAAAVGGSTFHILNHHDPDFFTNSGLHVALVSATVGSLSFGLWRVRSSRARF